MPKGCPSLQYIDCSYPKKAYAAWAKDAQDYVTSTSGGAASVLSQYIVSLGGVVYGCSVLPNIQISHIRVDKMEDLHLLKGSKYVQSQIEFIIPQLRNDVKQGVPVLFVELHVKLLLSSSCIEQCRITYIWLTLFAMVLLPTNS